jgi:hypothetical protein
MDEWRKLFFLVLGAAVLAGIANDRLVNPRLRLIARYADGHLVQDLETGLLHLI